MPYNPLYLSPRLMERTRRRRRGSRVHRVRIGITPGARPLRRLAIAGHRGNHTRLGSTDRRRSREWLERQSADVAHHRAPADQLHASPVRRPGPGDRCNPLKSGRSPRTGSSRARPRSSGTRCRRARSGSRVVGHTSLWYCIPHDEIGVDLVRVPPLRLALSACQGPTSG
jgi:hypothetical protein